MKQRTAVLLLLLSSGISAAQIDRPFLAMTFADAAANAFDGYTTTWIRPHWLATPKNVIGPCNVEAWSPWLYGKHPTAGQAALGSLLDFTATTGLALGLRHIRRPRLRRLWAVPFAFGVGVHLAGGLNNLGACR